MIENQNRLNPCPLEQFVMRSCYSCGQEKPLEDFNNEKERLFGKRSICKVCEKAYHKKWRDKNKDYVHEMKRAYSRRNPEKIKAYHKEWRDKNKDHVCKSEEKRRKELTDNYVKCLLCRGSELRHRDIPLELVEIKREYLKLLRVKKEVFSEH